MPGGAAAVLQSAHDAISDTFQLVGTVVIIYQLSTRASHLCKQPGMNIVSASYLDLNLC